MPKPELGPENLPPDEAPDFLPLTATADEEEVHRERLEARKGLGRENQRVRARARKAEAENAELKARLAEGADAKTVEQLTELQHRDAVRAAIEQYDFTAKGARSKTVAELLAMTKLDESGALVLVDEESGETLAADEKLLGELLPGELGTRFLGDSRTSSEPRPGRG